MTIKKSNEILAEYGLTLAEINSTDSGIRKRSRNKMKKVFDARTTVSYKTADRQHKIDGETKTVPGRIMPNARIGMFLATDSGEFLQLKRVHRNKAAAKSVMPVNEVVKVDIEKEKKEIEELENELTDNAPQTEPSEAKEVVFSSKAAENLAKENDVDFSQLVGTGTGGKVTKQDVQDLIDKTKVSV